MVVGVPRDREPPLFRLLYGEEWTKGDFQADNELRERFWTEDHCSYRGFSAWLTLEDARLHAADRNAHLEHGGILLTHAAEFRLRPHEQHACAWLPPVHGHIVVWAPAEDLVSRVTMVHPIEG
jgi:hypothetical protein